MGLRTSQPWKPRPLITLLLILCIAAGCKRDSWTLWDSYSTRFIDVQGRVIDHSDADRTTSEGQAYAMFFALVNNDRITFDRVLTWTQTNLAGGDLETHLPVSSWGFGGNLEWGGLDSNSASDADVWMAYSLVEAGRLWSVPVYSNLGRKMMDQIARTEVTDLPGFGPLLMPGPTGSQHDQVYTLNPSYMPLFIFERLAQVDPAGPWRQIALNIPRFLEQSARHGFAMDWVNYLPGDGFYPAVMKPTSATVETGTAQTVLSGGSYDAIRVYLWAGMINGEGQKRAQILNALSGMSVYLADHNNPPLTVSEQGIPLSQDGPIGFSAAVLPYLRAIPGRSPESAKQTVRMAIERNPSTGLFGKEAAYYDQNLALLATGYLDGRFWFGASGELNVEWTRQ